MRLFHLLASLLLLIQVVAPVALAGERDLQTPTSTSSLTGRRVALDGVGFFYDEGHAIQVADQNYLVPVEAGASDRSAAEWRDGANRVSGIAGIGLVGAGALMFGFSFGGER